MTTTEITDVSWPKTETEAPGTRQIDNRNSYELIRVWEGLGIRPRLFYQLFLIVILILGSGTLSFTPQVLGI